MTIDESTILMFYELYKIPIKYREIIKEIINNNRLIKKTFNQMLLYVKKERENKENREGIKTLEGWVILK
jgi:hypothetical protein